MSTYAPTPAVGAAVVLEAEELSPMDVQYRLNRDVEAARVRGVCAQPIPIAAIMPGTTFA